MSAIGARPASNVTHPKSTRDTIASVGRADRPVWRSPARVVLLPPPSQASGNRGLDVTRFSLEDPSGVGENSAAHDHRRRDAHHPATPVLRSADRQPRRHRGGRERPPRRHLVGHGHPADAVFRRDAPPRGRAALAAARSLRAVERTRGAGALHGAGPLKLFFARSAADAAPLGKPAAGPPRQLHVAGNRGLDRLARAGILDRDWPGDGVEAGRRHLPDLRHDRRRRVARGADLGGRHVGAQVPARYLCVILDHNKIQLDGAVIDIMNIEPFADKMRAFNWNVQTIDGHDYQQIAGAFDQARATKGKPTFVIAQTIKGKGVSFMEGQVAWHGVAPNKDQLAAAVAELRAAQAQIPASTQTSTQTSAQASTKASTKAGA